MPQHPPGQPGPTGGRTGTEPVLARSALGLRLVISSVAVPLFAAVTVLLSIWASNSSETDTPSGTSLTVIAAVFGVLTLIALVDLVIVVRRRSRAREAAREARRRQD
ncbi:hypothetical protein G3I34_04825 [Streptomyces sp. SID8014]|uniref:DUF6343 family protein n=1 Tax=Streptomyces sp. SID8014 TaxID=2706097 RepID=UPI0013BBC084|nr:hypothetical protein [Streptomyces sp. SID8014]